MNKREKLLGWLVFGALAWGALILFLVFVVAGCALVKQDMEGWSHKGHATIGAYPRHNEAVDGQTGKITKWKGELKEVVKWRRFEIEINPIVRLDNSWPEGSYTYTWRTAVLEGNLESRFYLIPSTALYYRKTKHWLLGHREDITERQACQCTYWNEVGVRVEW